MTLPRRRLLRIAGASAVGATVVGGSLSTVSASFSDGESIETTAGVNGREGPGLDYDVKRTYEEGTSGEIMNGPEDADGYTWWGVHFPSHGEWVWCVEDFLASEDSGGDPDPPTGCTDEFHSSQNVDDLARIIMSEASISDTPARTAVGFTVPTRMEQQGVSSVRDVWDAYATGQDPNSTMISLADDILSCSVSDNSDGATHFYSPMSMPKEGDDTSGYDTDGGLEQTAGLDRRNYRPGWSTTLDRVQVDDVPEAEFKFYR